MSSKTKAPESRLSADDVQAVLAATRALAAPFDLHTMLAEVAAAACQVLHADRASVWLHDATTDELFVEVAADLPSLRVPAGAGLVGYCARHRQAVNVADCSADPRFNPEVDHTTGYDTRCSLSLPLIDHQGLLVGVLQVLNPSAGVFDDADIALGLTLAAQCAVALTRARMTRALVHAERQRREIELASTVQRSTLPATLPQPAGYDLHGVFLPAEQTGGDTYDVAWVNGALLLLLADAAGHGIAAALSVVQMHAMLRMALQLGADLQTAFCAVNDRLAQTSSDGRFVTAFVGLLDVQSHRLRFISGGQGPILQWHAASATCSAHRATTFPMGAWPIETPPQPGQISLEPGDWLVLLSDGIYEARASDGQQFGRTRVEQVLLDCSDDSAADAAATLLAAVRGHIAGAAQDDDITALLVKRLQAAT